MQMVLEEAEYQRQSSQLTLLFAETHVKGVFEERLPLAVHAGMMLGCVASVVPAARTKTIAPGFDLADLQVRKQLPRYAQGKMVVLCIVRRAG